MKSIDKFFRYIFQIFIFLIQMWKKDDKGELNKLFKDIKVNKYISNL